MPLFIQGLFYLLVYLISQKQKVIFLIKKTDPNYYVFILKIDYILKINYKGIIMDHVRRTKIIATIGPVSNNKETLTKLINEGANYFRLNFSHSNKDEHLKSIKLIRTLEKEKSKPIGILGDLQGPKIRVGKIENGYINLKEKDNIIITTRQIMGNQNEISTCYHNLPLDVKSGNKLLLDDGLISLLVKSVDIKQGNIYCEVIYGGKLKSNKGINLPDIDISAPSLTNHDIESVIFALEHNVDYIALSFVRHPKDILQLKKLIKDYGKQTPVIAKIERKEALEQIDNIIDITDGLMVARGDLGVEMGIQKVPLLQKEIIRKCNILGKPVITATQMLESMINNPKPTRAEVSDVANAILDGTDTVMLSGETAVGNYPEKAVREMALISTEIELTSQILYNRRHGMDKYVDNDIEESISQSTCDIANSLKAKTILAWTQNGEAIRLLSKYHPVCPIISLTDDNIISRQVQLSWGVISLVIPSNLYDKKNFNSLLDYLVDKKLLCPSDLTVITGIEDKNSNIKKIKDKINSLKVQRV